MDVCLLIITDGMHMRISGQQDSNQQLYPHDDKTKVREGVGPIVTRTIMKIKHSMPDTELQNALYAPERCFDDFMAFGIDCFLPAVASGL